MASGAFPFFSFPPELVHLLFDQFVLSRANAFKTPNEFSLLRSTEPTEPTGPTGPTDYYERVDLSKRSQSNAFKRVMRLRLVSRQFMNYVDDAIFRHRLLKGFNHIVGSATDPYDQTWHAYVCSYLAYQARGEKDATTLLSRISRTAQILCQDAGELNDADFITCLRSLCHLALIDAKVEGVQEKLFNPSPERTDDWEQRLEVDVCVAAVYLGRKKYVQGVISEVPKWDGRVLYPAGDVRSDVFGSALDAAARQGDIDLLRLLLAFCPATVDARRAKAELKHIQRRVALSAAAYGREAAFNFALDISPLDLDGIEGRNDNPSRGWMILDEATLRTPLVDIYERAAAMLGPDSMSFQLNPIFMRVDSSADHGRTEMLRYFLGPNAYPGHGPARRNEGTERVLQKRKALQSAAHNGDPSTVRILLEHGADTTGHPLDDTPLMAAVSRCNVPIAKMLLDHGADVNEGFPAPIVIAVTREHVDMFRFLRDRGATLDTPETGTWAMALAQEWQLDSMREILLREGVPERFDVGEISPLPLTRRNKLKPRYRPMLSFTAEV